MDNLGEQLLAARSRKQAAHEVTLEVPGYEGKLWATYKPLGFKAARRIGQHHENLRDEVEKELRVAAETLAAACTKTEARIEGQTVELPPLGLELCEKIGLEGPETPVQAVMAIFKAEDDEGTDLVEQFVAVQGAERASNGQIDEELLGNSEAAS